MRRLIVLLFCLSALCAGPVFAGDAALQTSPPLLKSILAQLDAHRAVRAEFVQTRTDPALARPQISRGELLFVLGHGMLWQVTQPYRRTLAFSGRRSALVDADGRLHPLHGGNHVARVTRMLQSMLDGHADAVRQQFKIAASGTAQQWSLRFVPRDAHVARVLAAIRLDGGAFLQDIRIDMHDGASTRIALQHTREADTLSALEHRALGLP